MRRCPNNLLLLCYKTKYVRFFAPSRPSAHVPIKHNNDFQSRDHICITRGNKELARKLKQDVPGKIFIAKTLLIFDKTLRNKGKKKYFALSLPPEPAAALAASFSARSNSPLLPSSPRNSRRRSRRSLLPEKDPFIYISNHVVHKIINLS
jgi:hypothetical protein